MTAQLIGTFEHESPEWHAARAAGLGGSEIAAVLGLSKWESHYSLWLRKKGIIPPQTVNQQMSAGTRLEPVILGWWCDQHPEFVGDKVKGTYCHPDRAWQVANPDGAAMGPDGQAIIEAKFQLYDYDWGAPGTDEIPPYYLAQARWYLDVFDLDTCYVPVFIGSQGEFREYVVRADEDDQAFMREAGQRFIDSLANDERPPIDTHNATYEAVRKQHPGIDRDAEVELDALWLHYRDTKAAAELAADIHRQAKSTVLDALGDARLGLFNGEPVLRRQPGRGDTTTLQPIKPRRTAA